MSLILLIESGTEICSVAIARDGEVVALRESREGRDHARLVASYADELFAECGVAPSELSAVAVGKGPGSYTGLRIGVSFAKGLCYGLGIPLIGVSSMLSLVEMVKRRGDVEIDSRTILAPMIDARRMEVYTQLFEAKGDPLGQIEAKVIDQESFAEIRERGERLLMFGSGAQKCADTLPWAEIVEVNASAEGMANLAHEMLLRGEVEDVAYFEPFYLKEVSITKSNKRYF